MTTSNFQHSPRALVLALIASAMLHIIAFAITSPQNTLFPDPEPTPPLKEFAVQTLTEEELEAIEDDVEIAKPAPPKVAKLKPVHKQPEEKKEKLKEEEKPNPPDAEPKNRKAVVQETNAERPDEAQFLSVNDNKVSKETRAKETTEADVKPSNHKKVAVAMAERKEQLPTPEMRKTQPKPEPVPDPSPDMSKKEKEVDPIENADNPLVQRPKIDVKRLFQPSMADYDRVFGSQDQKARKRIAAQEGAKRPKLFRGWEKRDLAMRAAIENFITEIQPGNHTGVNAHRSSYASYIARIHRKIHPRWGQGYLMFLDTNTAASSPLNNPNLTIKLEMVIRADDGEVERVNIVSSSGELQFDAEAISIANAIGPHPKPPRQIVSPNGRVYIHWQFWRDTRQCGTFGASVFLLNVDEG